VEYALTGLGQELMPAIKAIVEVGHKLKRAQADIARCAVRTKAATAKSAA
jgi:DNA-binding HxlR family transcriptional regulator